MTMTNAMCDVCGGDTYMSNKSKYLKTEVRYAVAVQTNLYITSNVLSNKSVFFNFFLSFEAPIIQHELVMNSCTHALYSAPDDVKISIF